MKKILYILPILLLVFSCKDDTCETNKASIESKQTAYDANPGWATCIEYENALQTYLSSNCEDKDQINYTAIVQSYLDGLDCSFYGIFDSTCFNGIQDNLETGVDCGGYCTPCASTSTCTDGVQNGDETGVDCGGSCPPCGSTATIEFRCDIDGAAWTANSGFGFDPTFDTISNEASATVFDFSSTAIEYIKISLPGVPLLQSYSFADGVGTAPLDSAFFVYDTNFGSGTSDIYRAVTSSGAVTITGINTTDNTISGTFNVQAYMVGNPSNTLNFTNGQFTLPME